MTAAVMLENFHNFVRTLAQTRRIRMSEFFQDYDRLRSGFVTASQFSRCLKYTLGIQIDPEQEALVKQKYDMNGTGKINYKLFCDIIDQRFNAKDLQRNPEVQKSEPPELLGTMRTVQPLGPQHEQQLLELLQRIEEFYGYHGTDLRTCYEDFDTHHIGVVTESQFYRNFPRYPVVKESDIALLVQKYRDPDRPGLLNYLNLYHDIVAIGQQTMNMKDKKLILGPHPHLEMHVGHTPDGDLNTILDKIRVAVFKHGIRTTEFFKDHDRLRSGIITENQFICGLVHAVGKEAHLSSAEIQKVVEFYRQPDGSIEYKKFCEMMENVFTIADLEKKPVEVVYRPPRGALSRGLTSLSEKEEQQVKQILSKMSDSVRGRRLMMYTYFKDYDRSMSYTRIVTPTQFGRILHFLSLTVSLEDLKLLLRKFEDRASGDVNYPAFVQAVDKEFVGHALDDFNLNQNGHTKTENGHTKAEYEHTKTENRNTQMDSPSGGHDIMAADSKVSYEQAGEHDVMAADCKVSLEDLIVRIRHIVLTNRLRVVDFFQDYDPLHSGSMTKSQFRRGLGIMGLSTLGQHDLQDGQFKLLCDVYQNPLREDCVLWTRFLWDIETVFTQPNLERDPNIRVPPQEIFRVPKPGTVDWRYAHDNHRSLFDCTMDRLKQRSDQRRLLLKPAFHDFDKHNNGHVTKCQFRQCLTMLELHCTEPEMIALETKFCNDTGFNYLAFLAELQPEDPIQFMYKSRLENVRLVNQRIMLPELNAEKDMESVLEKVMIKVSKMRIRVLEFLRDFDRLRSGHMSKTTFRRALDVCSFDLKESELSILEDRYQSSWDVDHVDYLRFCDEIESIFTIKELEKLPLQEVFPFQPQDCRKNILPADQQNRFLCCMKLISDKVHKYQMQLFPLFEDFDRVHNGTVSKSQFHRVLKELELGGLVNQQELELVWQQYHVNIGGRDDVNYIEFCDMIYQLAKFEPHKP